MPAFALTAVEFHGARSMDEANVTIKAPYKLALDEPDLKVPEGGPGSPWQS